MPGLEHDDFDERIAAALQETAREPEANGVLQNVQRKRRARQLRRRTGAVAFGVAAVLAVGGVTTALLRDGGDDDGGRAEIATDESTTTTTQPPASQPADPVKEREEIAQDVAPGPVEFTSATEAVVTVDGIGARVEERDGQWEMTPASQCQVDGDTSERCTRLQPDVMVRAGAAALDTSLYGGQDATVAPANLVGVDGYVRGPIEPRSPDASERFWIASYDRTGAGFTYPPSHLVPIDDPGSAIDLQGEIWSLAPGEGVTWAVTHEQFIDADQIAFRLKRIRPDGSYTSAAIPTGEVPVGDVAAGSGFAWVPVQTGVLRYDATTGEYLDKIELGDQGRRAVAVMGDQVLVTNGSALARIEDGGLAGTDYDVVSERPLVDLLAIDEDTLWAMSATEAVRIEADGTQIGARVPLPEAANGRKFELDGEDLFIVSRAMLAASTLETVVFTLGDDAIEETIVVAGGSDVAVARTGPDELLVTSGGDLYTVDLTP